jgi:hypothetical protein
MHMRRLAPLLAVAALACAPPTPARVAQALPCPAPDPTHRGLAPWDVSHFEAACIRGPEGRWSVEKDASDAEGWRHTLVFDGVDGKHWTLAVIAPVGLARRLDGHVVVLDLQDGATLVSPDGRVVWRSRFRHCGHVRDVGIAWDDAITFSCGYMLLRLDAHGRQTWAKWPFGNTHVSGPWVDRQGTLYVSGGGNVAALGPDGTPRWTLSTGWNRYVGAIGWLPDGNLVFATTQDERHSPTSPEGYRFYYDSEPPELFEVTRSGEVVRRERFDAASPVGGWPTVTAAPEDRSGRVR